MAITPRPLAPAEDWQRISVPPDTKHDSLKRFLWYYYHWTKLPCDIFWMTSIERYQCEDLIALHQSINIFRMISNVPFQHYNQKIIIKRAKKKKTRWISALQMLRCHLCHLFEAGQLGHADWKTSIWQRTLQVLCLLSAWQSLASWVAMWRCFGAWPKRNHLLSKFYSCQRSWKCSGKDTQSLS